MAARPLIGAMGTRNPMLRPGINANFAQPGMNFDIPRPGPRSVGGGCGRIIDNSLRR